MKTIFKTLALGFLLMTAVACEKHDPFDENTITGAVGPEAKWDVASSMIKAGEAMEFTGQYYSTVTDNFIDHSEVWYELFEKEDKLVSASLIKAFSYSYTSNTTAQKTYVANDSIISSFRRPVERYAPCVCTAR